MITGEARYRAQSLTSHPVADEGQESSSLHVRGMMRHLKNQKGQNIIEYAIVIALVSAAMIAMSTYVYRSVQATQKVIEEELRN